MASNDKKRQQKLMKKRQKQKNKKKNAALSASANTEKAIIRRGNKYPIHECLLSADWQESGMAVIVIARRQSEMLIVFGLYMVDTFCLGVKDTFGRANINISDYKTDFRPMLVENHGVRPCSVEIAHQIIYGAVDYAADLGLNAHKDFLLSRNVLEKREDVPPNDDLEFGKNGKPLYVSGAHDHAGRILKRLESKLGKDGFNFIDKAEFASAEEYFEE